MKEHYDKLKEVYDQFVVSLMRKGNLPLKNTIHGYWGVTPLDETRELFERIKLSDCLSFIDLGSGDGRIVLLASLFCPKTVGIEGDRWLHENAVFLKRKLSSRDMHHFKKAKLAMDDFMNHDLSNYDTVFVSPDKPFHRGLENKLNKELTEKLIVYGWEFKPSSLKEVEEHIINGEKFRVYTKN